MRCVVQRVATANVRVNGDTIADIGAGLLLLVGATHSDGDADVSALVNKVINLRIFADDRGKMNLSALDTRANILVVSQFTLYADTRKGRRPSFITAADPSHAEPLVSRVVERIAAAGLPVQTGKFGAEMMVTLANDGPVTIWLDTDDLPPFQ